MELEEEDLARSERTELAAPTGLPEVHLVELRDARELLVPLEVRDRDPGLQESLSRSAL